MEGAEEIKSCLLCVLEFAQSPDSELQRINYDYIQRMLEYPEICLLCLEVVCGDEYPHNSRVIASSLFRYYIKFAPPSTLSALQKESGSLLDFALSLPPGDLLNEVSAIVGELIVSFEVSFFPNLLSAIQSGLNDESRALSTLAVTAEIVSPGFTLQADIFGSLFRFFSAPFLDSVLTIILKLSKFYSDTVSQKFLPFFISNVSDLSDIHCSKVIEICASVYEESGDDYIFDFLVSSLQSDSEMAAIAAARAFESAESLPFSAPAVSSLYQHLSFDDDPSQYGLSTQSFDSLSALFSAHQASVCSVLKQLISESSLSYDPSEIRRYLRAIPIISPLISNISSYLTSISSEFTDSPLCADFAFCVYHTALSRDEFVVSAINFFVEALPSKNVPLRRIAIESLKDLIPLSQLPSEPYLRLLYEQIGDRSELCILYIFGLFCENCADFDGDSDADRVLNEFMAHFLDDDEGDDNRLDSDIHIISGIMRHRTSKSEILRSVGDKILVCLEDPYGLDIRLWAVTFCEIAIRPDVIEDAECGDFLLKFNDHLIGLLNIDNSRIRDVAWQCCGDFINFCRESIEGLIPDILDSLMVSINRFDFDFCFGFLIFVRAYLSATEEIFSNEVGIALHQILMHGLQRSVDDRDHLRQQLALTEGWLLVRFNGVIPPTEESIANMREVFFACKENRDWAELVARLTDVYPDLRNEFSAGK